jgi:uncharacterized OB-fold protein
VSEPEPILPEVTALSRNFWEGCRDGELRLQRCLACRQLRYPIAPLCPHCLSPEVTWSRMSGGGTVFSFVIFRHAYHPAWRDKVPYCVALVELDEGPRMLTNLVGCDPEDVRVGQSATLTFNRVNAEISLPQFAVVAERPTARMP